MLIVLIVLVVLLGVVFYFFRDYWGFGGPPAQSQPSSVPSPTSGPHQTPGGSS